MQLLARVDPPPFVEVQGRGSGAQHLRHLQLLAVGDLRRAEVDQERVGQGDILQRQSIAVMLIAAEKVMRVELAIYNLALRRNAETS